ncbi:unnamed protein product [Adineta ricciae]|uniref:Beta-1,4-galactosyltransferase n=1 Tax=Adineta ricciae TaxID=249248 RepID=A0A815B8J0_ADIRI|nr:unnamed protein product [Adineta ricciae]
MDQRASSQYYDPNLSKRNGTDHSKNSPHPIYTNIHRLTKTTRHIIIHENFQLYLQIQNYPYFSVHHFQRLQTLRNLILLFINLIRIAAFLSQTMIQLPIEYLYPGGHFFPKTCRSKQRLAVIICYRNREAHLKLFLNHIHAFLQQQQLDYTIFVVNQHGQEQFNRAALFDVGFLEAIKLYSFDCFIFHDVDLLPEDLRNVYKCGKQPKHMSVAVDTFKYKLPYPTLFGGVTAISLTDFIDANGYATIYWGWGGEDDDMYQRVNRTLRKSIARYPTVIARYQMICSHNHVSAEANPSRDIILRSNYDHKKDGLNSIKYVLHKLTFYRLFTLINVTLTEESLNEISKRMNIKFPKKTTTMKMRVLPRKSA